MAKARGRTATPQAKATPQARAASLKKPSAAERTPARNSPNRARSDRGAAKPAAKPARAATESRRKKVLTPYDPEYERPLSELPQLTFPNSAEHEFRVAADERRKVRIRNETIFGALLFFGGLFALVAGHTPAFLALAAIAVAAMAAYELIISGLE